VRDVAPDLVTVRILRPVVAPTGGHWNPGETAGFPPAVAASLIARGVARAIPKAPSAPPLDKMQRGAPIKK